MCDLFQANPWKPLLCTNCHQNRSGHHNHSINNDLPSSNSSIHLYEEIMAQYFTTNLPPIISNNKEEIEDNDDDDSFSDEEQNLNKPISIEFIQNQSMINTQGIVLMGPDIPSKPILTKKSKKINLLKKSKSNADECLKKSDIIENNSSKLWWFKTKKTSTNDSSIIQTELTTESITSPIINNKKIRVLPEINKLTINEALNIARRQHSLPNHELKLPLNNNNKPFRSLTVSSNYGSSTSSSTQSSNEYDTNLIIGGESTYLTAISPIEKNLSLINIFDKTNKLIIERLNNDLRIIINEYKQNLPVVRFQTFKSFLNQEHLIKNLSNESIYFLLLQILDEFSSYSMSLITYDHFLITYHSTIPIIIITNTVSSNQTQEQTIDEFIKNLAKKFFNSLSLPIFNDILTFETIAYQYLFNQIFQYSNKNFDKNNISMQRIQLLELFWNKIQSLRNIQINDDNERNIFALYYLMRYISQSDHFI